MEQTAKSRSGLSLILVLLLSISTFGCCATLPNVGSLVDEFPVTSQELAILDANGPLSPVRRTAVIDRLRNEAECGGKFLRQLVWMQSISGSPLTWGNQVELLIDGPAAYTAMLDAIKSARDHVNLETYVMGDDEIGNTFADLLIRKQAEGVQVNLIYDSYGCHEVPASFFQRLRDAGVSVLEFHPVNPIRTDGEWLWYERDHRKTLIVDGRVAITGGINISRHYFGSPLIDFDHPVSGWRDTDVQIEGPAVAEFQKLFIENWSRAGGSELPERDYFPKLENVGDELVRVVGSTAGTENRTTYMMYILAVSNAVHSIHLTHSFFVPDSGTLKALCSAAERGIDVQLILPASPPERLTYYAGRYYYSRLLKCGVSIYERRGPVLHAKTGVIDGVWSTVGSTNLDMWGLLRNDDVNAVIVGRAFGDLMEEVFRSDLAQSDEISLDTWDKRSVVKRMREWLAHLIGYWL